MWARPEQKSQQQEYEQLIANLKKYVPRVVGVIISGILLWASFFIVHPGFTAIQIRMGRIVTSYKESGTYFKMPFIDSIKMMSNGIQKLNVETNALSKDLQSISIGVNINYRYTNEVELYKTTRGMPEEIILVPFCHESIKAILARYTAEELIQHRHETKEQIYQDLRDRLKPHYIEFIEVNFAHADFSQAFMHAVEEKQIAIQEAMMARNMTEKTKEKAIQAKIDADAESYAQQVKRQSLTKELIELKAIEKWDGKLPSYINGPIPFIKV